MTKGVKFASRVPSEPLALTLLKNEKKNDGQRLLRDN